MAKVSCLDQMGKQFTMETADLLIMILSRRKTTLLTVAIVLVGYVIASVAVAAGAALCE